MKVWSEGPARLGVRTAAGRDALAAALLILLSTARLLPAVHNGTLSALAPGVVAIGFTSAAADLATIALRRIRPVLALAAASVIPLAAMLLPARPALIGVGAVVCSYTVACLLPQVRATVAIVVCGAVHASGGVFATLAGGGHGGLLTFWGVLPGDLAGMAAAVAAAYLLPATAGFAVQARRAGAARAAASIARDREERARTAVAEERARIARELHDIAAHDLSAIVVQAGAADRLLDRDPAAARATLRAIRSQGRDTLAALRALVGLMRDSEPGAADGRAPALTGVEETVRRFRTTGMDVEVSATGEPRPLPVTTGLAVSRLVREALTNARRHAPGAKVSVTTTFGEAGFAVAVRNTRPDRAARPTGADGSDGGYGLLGMRERVTHAGGALTVGPQPDGGWLVSASFPAAMPASSPASSPPEHA
ncbi:sensor histidine kinase [Nonomuraea endophytica]|uniref:histidine kinase n=1 Tax=Nonomuraea endophytica TaxID=714136 RepID=A0A7W8AFV8_9ACTN|nr:histidine kinase [Nonomuraea endophytica]MBB5084321.1 signal transduction histidine kinase [Nonomuraea endophytica]